MKKGDTAVCTASRGYLFTTGKEYVVEDYQPKHHDINFTWPAYVQVVDDCGEKVWCHANRFTVKEGA